MDDRKAGIEYSMKRNVSMEEISDGKLYGINDMVKVGCNECEGCSSCCSKMGSTIILSPLDIYNLTINLDCSFEALLKDRIELNVVDGIILPNLKLSGKDETCSFLNSEGRCSIHTFRPGICRLFPLGRIYREDGFDYFLQVNECKKENKTKVKVKKWLGITDIKSHEEYIFMWHKFINNIIDYMSEREDDNLNKQINMYVLQNFFIKPYEKDEFYKQFNERLNIAGNINFAVHQV